MSEQDKVMSEQDKAFRKILKKLGAMRNILPLDERDILDEMVQGTYSEVEGHVVKVPFVDRHFRDEDDEGEVQAHLHQEGFGAEKTMKRKVTMRNVSVDKDIYLIDELE